MTKQEAIALLDLPSNAGPGEALRRYRDLYSEFQIRLSNAPTPNLKRVYQRTLADLDLARDLLFSRDGPDVSDLPSPEPVFPAVGSNPLQKHDPPCAADPVTTETTAEPGASPGIAENGLERESEAPGEACSTTNAGTSQREIGISVHIFAIPALAVIAVIATACAAGWYFFQEYGALQSGRNTSSELTTPKRQPRKPTKRGRPRGQAGIAANKSDRPQESAPDHVSQRPLAEARAGVSSVEQTWTDPDTGLTWTKRDNGSDVNWYEANNYCRNLLLAARHQGGGHQSAWRLPTIEELARVYDSAPGEANRHKKRGVGTNGWAWSSTLQGSGAAWIFSFDTRPRAPWSHLLDQRNMRALCVCRYWE